MQVQVASYILIPQRNVNEYFIFFQMHADRVIKDDEYMIIYLISSKTDEPNLFFKLLFIYFISSLYSEISTERPGHESARKWSTTIPQLMWKVLSISFYCKL